MFLHMLSPSPRINYQEKKPSLAIASLIQSACERENFRCSHSRNAWYFLRRNLPLDRRHCCSSWHKRSSNNCKNSWEISGSSNWLRSISSWQFDSVMQQSQARQVHKELQDTMAQLEAIPYEIRSISLVNPGPLTQRPMDDPSEPTPSSNGNSSSEKYEEKQMPKDPLAQTQDYSKPSSSINLHSQATAYARLAESEAVKTASLKSSNENENFSGEPGLFIVLPVSAESTGLLPDHKESAKGSDIVLEALLEAEVARNAKDFFSQPENKIK